MYKYKEEYVLFKFLSGIIMYQVSFDSIHHILFVTGFKGNQSKSHIVSYKIINFKDFKPP